MKGKNICLVLLFLLLPSFCLAAKGGMDVAQSHEGIRIPAIAFRSNLLVPLMNIGLEVPVSDRISLEADLYSPWVPREWIDRVLPPHRYCFQLVGGSVGCRYWIGESGRLCGHSIGLVTTGGIYDLAWDWKGSQGEFALVGIDYLFGLPVGRGGVHLEFNLGVGFGAVRYNDYEVRPADGKLIDAGGRRLRHTSSPVRIGVRIAVPVFKREDKGR